MVWLGHKFEVSDRLKNLVASCSKSYIEGVQANHVADIGMQAQARLIELKDSLKKILS